MRTLAVLLKGRLGRPIQCGPPVAATLGRLAGYRYRSAPNVRLAEIAMLGAGNTGPLARTASPVKVHVSAGAYSLSRSVVGASRWKTVVSPFRLALRTSLPTSAKPIALIRNASRLRCSSTIDLLIFTELPRVLTRSADASP